MCSCPAHHDLVDCVCQCDHTHDRLAQWHARALAAERAIERVRAIPPTPQDTDIDPMVNRIYRQGWESVIDAIDRALAAPEDTLDGGE